MLRIQRIILTIGALLMITLGTLPLAGIAQAQERLCFTETNQCIEGRFLEYWRGNGGLAVFGFPIGPAQQELNRDTGKTYLTQWFERNRFELHPENARPYDVLLGRLGDDTLIKMGRDWRQEYQQVPPTSGECEMPNTGGKVFLLCPPFRTYYRAHGLEFDGQPGFSGAESLALFGLPLTQPKMETNSSGDTVMTQWFERARFEYHPNNPEPYKMLLGLLGNELKGTSKPVLIAPTVTYIAPNERVYEIRGSGQPVEVATTLDQGTVIDAIRDGDQVVQLRERGLQSVAIGQTPRTIATFTQGNARFGALVDPANSDKILYVYARDSDAPIGFEGIAGVIENRATARKVHEAPNTMQVLGLDKDGRSMLVINQGQDTSWVGVQVVALDDGRVLTTLPYAGDGPAALAPNRETVATPSMRNGHPDTVVFYSLNNQTGGPRNAVLPSVGWNITQVLWSRDSVAVYALAYPSTDNPTGELWRVDPVTLKSSLMASDLPLDTRLLSVSSDGQQILVQTEAGALVLDLTAGRTLRFTLPQDAVIARWH